MDAFLVLTVISEEDEQCCLLVPQTVACTIPYLQTRMNTEVGKKRKHEAEILITLPAHCTVSALKAILACMSCNDGKMYKQSFHWAVESVSDAVALIRTADFLLLSDLIPEVLRQCDSFFRKLEDIGLLTDLSHPDVKALVHRVQRPLGKLIAFMSAEMVIDMCRNNLGKETLAGATAKTASQWLRASDRTADVVAELATTVFSTVRATMGASLHIMELAKELTKHTQLNLQLPILAKAQVDLISCARNSGPGPVATFVVERILTHSTFDLANICSLMTLTFFDGDEFVKKRVSCEMLAKAFIEIALQKSNNELINVVSRVFRDNGYTQFDKNEQSYLDIFRVCFHSRMLTSEELKFLFKHLSGAFLPLLRSTTVLETLGKMSHDHHRTIANFVSEDKEGYRIVSMAILKNLCPDSQTRIVAAVMPHLASLDSETQAWITKAIEEDVF